ncbi:MAG: carboxylating nicotinate-nucleotide diphosphorylase [bacterium]
MNLEPIRSLIKRALDEDRVFNDVTTRAICAPCRNIKGSFIIKENGIVCGLDVAREIFSVIGSRMKAKNKGGVSFKSIIKDGSSVRKNQVIADVKGPAEVLLGAERTTLNFMQRLSGIATLTSRYVKEAEPYGVKIYDTRKTTPGLRYLEKYAVRCGGGFNHRMSMEDMVLIKDNHLALLAKNAIISDTIKEIKSKVPKKIKIEVETENLGQIREVLEAEADIIMLDNMASGKLREAVNFIKTMRYKGKPLIEVSGGIRLRDVKRIARLGVDRIAVGALTHSAAALDISLEITS